MYVNSKLFKYIIGGCLQISIMYVNSKLFKYIIGGCLQISIMYVNSKLFKTNYQHILRNNKPYRNAADYKHAS
jgi:hypothetical protein